MPSSTATPTEAREAAIVAYNAEQALMEEAKGKGDAKSRLSHGAKMANRSREIREAELELALEGTAFEPWQPQRASRTTLTPLTEAEIVAKLTPLTALLKNKATPETVKHTADTRIQALLKAAEKRGYKIADPRKS